MSTEKIMEQAQAFASAWSVVGGPCGRLGDATEVATQEKDELKRMVAKLTAERDDLTAMGILVVCPVGSFVRPCMLN